MRISKRYRPEACVSRNKLRYNITDPYLDVASKRLISTNGHCMAALPVELDKGERSRYLARNLLKVARQLGEKDDDTAHIEDEQVACELGPTWPVYQARAFPEWKKAIPPFKRGAPGTVTVALNAQLLKSVADAIGEDIVAITLEIDRDDQGVDGEPAKGGILVEAVAPGLPAYGVLMPYRLDGLGDQELTPGQSCPAPGCGKLLASGAHCPDHGDPLTAQQDLAEKVADDILKRAGARHLTKKELKGPAVARTKSKKKGRRRG